MSNSRCSAGGGAYTVLLARVASSARLCALCGPGRHARLHKLIAARDALVRVRLQCWRRRWWKSNAARLARIASSLPLCTFRTATWPHVQISSETPVVPMRPIPLAHRMPSHKRLKTKITLAKKMKQNRPIPQWIRLRTDNKIRCGAAQHAGKLARRATHPCNCAGDLATYSSSVPPRAPFPMHRYNMKRRHWRRTKLGL